MVGPRDGSQCPPRRFGHIHGFFHITNLDFYRSDIVQRWAEIWIGDGFLQRSYDDQAAVTVPAAILAPERSWEMRSHGINLQVFHNNRMDGKERVGGFFRLWDTNVSHNLPSANGVCPIKSRGRR